MKSDLLKVVLSEESGVSLKSRVFREKPAPVHAFKGHTYHPYIHIYLILHCPPLILSHSLRSLANKQISPISIVTPESVSLTSLAHQ